VALMVARTLAFSLLLGLSALACAGGAGSRVSDASPHNGKLAFSCSGCPLNVSGGSIYTVRADGGELRRLTPRCSPDSCLNAQQLAWSPAGRRLALTTLDELWVMHADGASKRRILAAPAGEAVDAPAWSPDGRHVAFARDNGIWTIDVDRRELRLVLRDTRKSGFASSLSWSPDGRSIAFGTGREELYVLALESSTVRRIGGVGLRGRYPRWSPDGRRILFLRWHNDGVSVSSVRRSGTGLVELARDPELNWNVNPTWSPDGRFVAFAIRREFGDDYGSGQFVIVSVADGTTRRVEIPSLPGNVYGEWYGIDWQPLVR
jgi:Tol biopolymer transport system component